MNSEKPVSLTLPLKYWLRLQVVLAVIDELDHSPKQLDYSPEQFALIAELRREFNRVFNAQRANAELPNPSAEAEKSAKTKEQK